MSSPIHADFRYVGTHIDHISQAKPGVRVYPERLYVITAISNPCQWRTRYELARAFQKHMAESGVILMTVEAVLGGREFEVTEPNNPWHLQFRSHHLQHLWLKENLINLGVQRLSQLDPNWKYVAWIDADVVFMNPSWAQNALQALQHYEVIQPFTHAYDLGPTDEVIQTHQGFGYSYNTGAPLHKQDLNGYGYGDNSGINGAFWHPGYAWAARRSFFDKTGGLFDTSALGASDHIMAKAILGRANECIHPKISKGFKRHVKTWENRAKKLYRNLGHSEGTLMHRFHGTKANRAYQSRWSYLTDGAEPGLASTVVDDLMKFNPDTDLIRDYQGLYQIPEEKIKLRDDFRKYFAARQEDPSF